MVQVCAIAAHLHVAIFETAKKSIKTLTLLYVALTGVMLAYSVYNPVAVAAMGVPF